MRSEPGEFFPPDRAAIFQLSDISRELSFGFPFSFAGKEKGKGIYVIIGRTGRASLLLRAILQAVSRGVNSGYSWIPHRVRDDKGYHSARDAHRVTPHSDAGSRKVNLTGNLVGIPGCRIQVRYDRSAKPLRPMGESGKKNDGEGRMRGKDV